MTTKVGGPDTVETEIFVERGILMMWQDPGLIQILDQDQARGVYRAIAEQAKKLGWEL